MTTLLAIACILLIIVVVIQISKVTDLANRLRGEEEAQTASNKRSGLAFLIFLIGFLAFCIGTALYYKNWMLGYGPHHAASEHGDRLDNMFNVTLFFTGIVFIITQVLLFYFAYKYSGAKGRKVLYIPHDNRLEVIWTVVPAVVMTFLVISGLDAWNTVMADVSSEEEFMEIEATGFQFAWQIRYPGADGKLGTRNFKLTTANNQLGMDFTDPKAWDDVIPGQELYLPVGKKVRVRIIAKDVLHNFYLPHFRVKMDAVPGMPTYFVFTPVKTTAEYRNELRKYDDFNVPSDPTDPNGPKRWEKFEYELACAELCGKGHYSMKRIFKVVSQEEYDAWYKKQESFYLTQIRGKADDPNKDKVLDIEIRQRAKEFSENVKKAVESTNAADKTLTLNYINFETGSATLTVNSRYELDNLVTGLNTYPGVVIEVAGHTDNTGDPAANLSLSQARAASVVKYLTDRGISEGRLRARGYGDTKPLAPNDSEENRAKNRRTEFTILTPAS